MPGIRGGQKRVSDSLEVELQMIVSHHVVFCFLFFFVFDSVTHRIDLTELEVTV